MIELCIPLSFAAALIFCGKENRKPYYPAITFPFLWMIIFYLGKARWFTLYPTGEGAVWCMQIGTLAFTAGALLWGRARKHVRPVLLPKCFPDNGLRYALLYVVALVVILYFAADTVAAVRTMISGGSLNDVRHIAQAEDANTGFANLFYNFFILPAAILLEVLGVIDFWFGKRRKKLFLLSLVLIGLRVLGDGGRTPLFNMFLYMPMGYLLTRRQRTGKRDRKEKKQRVFIRLFFLMAVVLLAIATFSRTGTSVRRVVYFYFSMPGVMLSQWMETVDMEGLMTYGLTSLNGLFYGVSYIIKNTFGVAHPPLVISAFNEIAATDAVWLRITGQGTRANAYVSLFWFFYTDLRYIGVVIGAFLYGMYMSQMYANMKRDRSERNICLFLLGFQGMFFSFIRFPFAKTYYWIAYAAIRFVVFRKGGAYAGEIAYARDSAGVT